MALACALSMFPIRFGLKPTNIDSIEIFQLLICMHSICKLSRIFENFRFSIVNGWSFFTPMNLNWNVFIFVKKKKRCFYVRFSPILIFYRKIFIRNWWEMLLRFLYGVWWIDVSQGSDVRIQLEINLQTHTSRINRNAFLI